MPEAVSATPVKITVYHWIPGVLGLLAFVMAIAWFVALGRTTPMLRENGRLAGDELASAKALPVTDTGRQAKIDTAEAALKAYGLESWRPIGQYSLGRTQMAFWLFIIVAGFIFIWLATNIYQNAVTNEMLVLLGLSGATGLSAGLIGTELQKTSTSRGFLKDIVEDSAGPSLTRIQAVVWTLILGAIFIWNVVWNFAFPKFDTTLLLVGIVGSMYLGFKEADKPKPGG